MTRARTVLLSVGVVLFLGVMVSQGLPAIAATLGNAGWGLLAVAAFHALPLLLDAIAIRVLFDTSDRRRTLRDAVLARWVGESANSLMPAGQIGGPVLMARHLAQREMPVADAAAAITVSTTLQTFAQILFALVGVILLGAQASHSHLGIDRQRLPRGAGRWVLPHSAARILWQADADRQAILRGTRLGAIHEPG
jgi:Lysylphosphatidylglycerol synthase TM region